VTGAFWRLGEATLLPRRQFAHHAPHAYVTLEQSVHLGLKDLAGAGICDAGEHNVRGVGLIDLGEPVGAASEGSHLHGVARTGQTSDEIEEMVLVARLHAELVTSIREEKVLIVSAN
jgi:hypothetical protein